MHTAFAPFNFNIRHAGFGRSFTISKMMEMLYTNKVLRFLSKPFMDLEAKAERQVGDSWTVSKARASYLEELQLVRRETI